MTRQTNARIAGVTFLLYIAAGISDLVVIGRTTTGEGIAATLAGFAQHATVVRAAYLLPLLECFCALVLAVTLYAITRVEDSDLAMLGLTCRVGEALIGISLPVSLGLLWLATASGANAPDAESAHALAAFLQQVGAWKMLSASLLFAVGSTLFSYLMLRGRMIPVPLAWLGVVASALLVILTPLQLVEFVGGPITQIMWIPMAAFEVPLALWLIIKGVAEPRNTLASGG